ncbi:MAG: DUF7309 domain-containing protein [Kiritimatiellia bacterium]
MKSEHQLDETVPTREQIDKMYALAKRVLDISPWEFMVELQILAVQHSAEDTSFLIVTGAMGEYFSVQIYSSFHDLDAMLRLDEGSHQDMVDIMFGMPQLKLVFAKANELLPGDRERIKASGIAFKKGKNPSLQSMMPGYDNCFPGGRELDRMAACIEQLLFMLEGGQTIPEISSPMDPICTRVCREGGWEQEMKSHPLLHPEPDLSVSEELLNQVLGLPRRDRSMACGCFVIPTRFREKGRRPTVPRACMLMDVESQFIIGMELLVPEPGKLWNIAAALDTILKKFVTLGFRPSRLRVNGPLLQEVGEQFCTMIDVDYDERHFQPMLQAFDEIMSRLGC